MTDETADLPLATRSAGPEDGAARTPGRADEPNGVRQADPRRVRAQQSEALSRLGNLAALRRGIDHGLDLLRLRLDSFPHGIYQPVDLPVRRAKRVTGTRTRWEQISHVVDRCEPQTAMDLGANAGFFSIELGRRGVRTLAVDFEPGTMRTLTLAIARSGLDNVATTRLELSPASAEMLPFVDASLFLSVWHHVVRFQGMDDADAVTRQIWKRTAKVMFFDSGEAEMDASFQLPALEPDARVWFTAYLERVCEGSQVEHLGLHDAFDGEGNPCQRNLFAVVRADG